MASIYKKKIEENSPDDGYIKVYIIHSNGENGWKGTYKMNVKEIANALVFDECVKDSDTNTNSYYFKAISAEYGKAIIDQFYKDDGFEFVGCSICIDENAEKKYVEATYLIPHIMEEGEVMEMFPVTVKVEPKLTRLLMKKVPEA